MTNLTGRWYFFEEFDGGVDEGEAILQQEGNLISGTLAFTESIEDDEPFDIMCQIKGLVNDKMVTIEVESFEITKGDKGLEYFTEERQGIINSQGQIVGSSEDEQGINGVFTLTRTSAK